jgi:ABC-type Zn uptake system ZnuABC Zn-binding protein ZnuA
VPSSRLVRGRRRSWAAVVLASLLVAASTEAAPRTIVTTIEPIAMIARELAGEGFVVTALVPPGASPHAFEPRPRDVARLVEAELVVMVGGDLDAWTGRLLGAAGRPLETLVLLELPELAPLPSAPGAAELDPHVWLDPIRVRDVLAPAIAERLARLAPEVAADTAARLADFQERLTRLDAELRAGFAGAARRYVAFHAAWRYFGARYGLEEVGVVEEAPGEDPTPRELARLAAAARAAGVRAILVEPQLDPRVARTLAAEFGGTTVLVDPNGDPTDPARAGYEALLRWNAAAFARALGAAP